MSEVDPRDQIAIIGMAGRFPGARGVGEFWRNLCEGKESIHFFSEEELIASGVAADLLHDPHYVRACGVLEGVDLFDAEFFGFTPREAELMDPQQRIFLECAWEALEGAGYDPGAGDAKVGVFAGSGWSTYHLKHLETNPRLAGSVGDFLLRIGNEKDYLPLHVSYKLGLRGPSFSISTACSTSLVAVHEACLNLLDYRCDMALAGGVLVRLPQTGYLYEEGNILSPDGHCRPFDANAKGTVGGNGVGIVVLKRLEDALSDGDDVVASIIGSAINNDGALKVGFTAPSVAGQSDAIIAAQLDAGVDPETITYVETHGTGTVLGDPIEIEALTRAFRRKSKATRFCAIGSLKGNIGHVVAAAGVAGLIKTALMLRHKVIPPSLHFETPNPKIDFENGPFYVNTNLSEWKTDRLPRRAAVSSFGIGGTNAHAVLEEVPPRAPADPSVRTSQLIVLSARTDTALDAVSSRLKDHLVSHPKSDLADVAYTLQVGRRAFDCRRMVVAKSTADAAEALSDTSSGRVVSSKKGAGERPVVFMFPGQGAQQVGMGHDLYRVEPVFTKYLDAGADVVKSFAGIDVRTVLYPEPARDDEAGVLLDQTSLTQPALFLVEYALAMQWMNWGIRPWAMIGHSIGEYVAACLAGVFRFENALELVCARAKLMQQLPPGGMTAVPLPEEELKKFLGDGLDLAAVNEPSLCVLSGPNGAVETFEANLSAQGIGYQRLRASRAFHSAMVDPILEQFEGLVREAGPRPPHLPFVSNLTGQWISPEEATDPSYWAGHLRRTVRFSDGLGLLLGKKDVTLLEVGPGRTLTGFCRRHPAKNPTSPALSSFRHSRSGMSDMEQTLTSLGQLWLRGISVDWRNFYSRESRRRVSLPTYPFQRKRHWIEAARLEARPEPTALRENVIALAAAPRGEEDRRTSREREGVSHHPAMPVSETERRLAAIWEELLGIEQVGTNDDFLELGGHSLLATQVLSRANRAFNLNVSLDDFFEHLTIAKMAKFIDGVRWVAEVATGAGDGAEREEGSL